MLAVGGMAFSREEHANLAVQCQEHFFLLAIFLGVSSPTCVGSGKCLNTCLSVLELSDEDIARASLAGGSSVLVTGFARHSLASRPNGSLCFVFVVVDVLSPHLSLHRLSPGIIVSYDMVSHSQEVECILPLPRTENYGRWQNRSKKIKVHPSLSIHYLVLSMLASDSIRGCLPLT